MADKRNIVKALVKKAKAKRLSFVQLGETEEHLQQKSIPGRNLRVPMGSELDAFGEGQLSNPKFIRKLRKLQEKYRITQFA